MGIVKQIGKKSSRKSLKTSASLLGLAAGAVGWSGLAQAASEETGSQLMLLPEHYELMQDGVVVFKLESGESLSLTADQYLILEDGLLLITDEIAQASMQSLPVMGSIRAQLTSELQPVRSPDGSVVQASDASPLWSGDGPAPRLFEEVDIERFELASHSEDPTTGRHDGWNPVDGGLLAGGLLSAAGLLSNNSQEPEDSADSESDDAAAAPPLPDISSAGPIWMDSEVPDAGSFSITGTTGSAWIGYTEPNATSTDAITEMAKDSTATIDMAASGPTKLDAGVNAAKSGSLQYKGGLLADTLTFASGLAQNGSVSFDMSAGGANTLTMGQAAVSGSLSYTGGANTDTITTGGGSGSTNGVMSFDMSNGGNNTLNLGPGNFPKTFSYIGGPGTDTLIAATAFMVFGSHSTVFDMTDGGANTLTFNGAAIGASGTKLDYQGGAGADKILASANFLYGVDTSTVSLGAGADELSIAGDTHVSSPLSTITVDLGNDTDGDKIEFHGYVNAGSYPISTYTIQNFKVGDDSILLGLPTATSQVVLNVASGDTQVTYSAFGSPTVQFTIEGVALTAANLSLTGGGDVLIS
jgi:hypothetical protein